MSKRILITGGFGYIGGRIATYLGNDNSYLIRLGSRKYQSSPDWLPNAEVVSIDLLDNDSLPKLMSDVDIVIHLAAMNENDCLINPAKAVLVNTLGTRNILEAAIAMGVKQFIYFSTAHVYKAPLIGLISEKTIPEPIHPYAITHHGAEDFVLAANKQKKIKGTVIRLSNAFGAPVHAGVDRWTLIVNDLCKQLVETRKMVLRSSGLQKRDFITLNDVSRAMEHLLNLTDSDRGDGLFNLGGDSCLSILEITELLAKRCKVVLGFKPEIIRPESDKNEKSPNLIFDIEKFKKTGFILQGDIEKEIDETLQMCFKFFKKK